MKQDNKAKIDRRDLLRVLGAGAGAAASPVALVGQAQADSDDVKAFYRVNHYPK